MLLLIYISIFIYGFIYICIYLSIIYLFIYPGIKAVLEPGTHPRQCRDYGPGSQGACQNSRL